MVWRGDFILARGVAPGGPRPPRTWLVPAGLLAAGARLAALPYRRGFSAHYPEREARVVAVPAALWRYAVTDRTEGGVGSGVTRTGPAQPISNKHNTKDVDTDGIRPQSSRAVVPLLQPLRLSKPT